MDKNKRVLNLSYQPEYVMVNISNKLFVVDLNKVVNENFLILKNNNFNKISGNSHECIAYERDSDIFKNFVLPISYNENINVDDINLNNISHINDELNFFGLDYFDIDGYDDNNIYFTKLFNKIRKNFEKTFKISEVKSYKLYEVSKIEIGSTLNLIKGTINEKTMNLLENDNHIVITFNAKNYDDDIEKKIRNLNYKIDNKRKDFFKGALESFHQRVNYIDDGTSNIKSKDSKSDKEILTEILYIKKNHGDDQIKIAVAGLHLIKYRNAIHAVSFVSDNDSYNTTKNILIEKALKILIGCDIINYLCNKMNSDGRTIDELHIDSLNFTFNM
jgi:hypothetical protein